MDDDCLDNWKDLISEEMEKHGECWEDLVSCTMTDEEAEEGFERDHEGPHGREFTAWTKNRVYFPFCYDGFEGCKSVPRNPDGGVSPHIGT